jgi:hypothetical protein
VNVIQYSSTLVVQIARGDDRGGEGDLDRGTPGTRPLPGGAQDIRTDRTARRVQKDFHVYRNIGPIAGIPYRAGIVFRSQGG